MQELIFGLAVLIFSASLFKFAEGLYASRLVPDLAAEIPPDVALGPRPPRLSVIVPACNEERSIETAVRSLLEQDYPALELVLVNDRSTDATGAIMDRLAAEFPQLRVVHIDHLPDRWLGKNHALWVGAHQSSGEILLFTDADVHYHKTALRRAVAFLERRRLDHLTLAPDMTVQGYLLQAWVGFFIMAFLAYKTPYLANNPRSRVGMGIGAFNMIRREGYERIGTHQAISLRPDDDLRLGQRLKRMGLTSNVAMGRDLLSVEWYTSLGEGIRGLEKNTFAGLEYSLFMVLFSVTGILTIMVWPFIALFIASGWAQALYAGAILLQLATYVMANQMMGPRALHLALAYPLSALLFAFTVARASYLTLRHGGITWRGTFYPLALLKSQSGLPR
ncbi:MAG: glycosyltransferase [Bacillota bacterium]